MELREINVTPHIAQNMSRRSEIDGGTTHHSGYAMSQRIRKGIERFGWMKTIAGLRQTRYRGLERVGWCFTMRPPPTTSSAGMTPRRSEHAKCMVSKPHQINYFFNALLGRDGMAQTPREGEFGLTCGIQQRGAPIWKHGLDGIVFDANCQLE